jgi:nucleotide-binding universal stress UspA family protein
MKTSKRKNSGCVIWAVDPFEDECRPSPSGAREMARWVRRAGLELLPVYVVSPSPREKAEGKIPRMEDAQATVVRYLREFGLRGVAEPCVILDNTSSRAGAIRDLLQLADERAASWIVVSSHGRSGMERLVLGSFAEALLREARQPVLFLSSKSRPVASGRKREKALFATDFSERSAQAFGLFLEDASRERFDMVIFHSLVYPMPTVDGMMGLGSSLPESYFAEQEAWSKAEGGRWVEKAARRGINARFVVRTGGGLGSVGREILEIAAKERTRLIAMASLSGPLSRFVVGSAPYDVFRAQRCPVWIYGPKASPMQLVRRPAKTSSRKLEPQDLGKRAAMG